MRSVLSRLKTLCRGASEPIAGWIYGDTWQWTAVWAGVIVAGCGLYGGTVGLWRAPLQAGFAAIKLPLIVLATCARNALLNGLLAQVLGTGLTFRQCAQAILMSFALFAAILAALAPVALFILWNTSPLTEGRALLGHSVTLLSHVGFIAYAGIVANTRLFRLLVELTGRRETARRVLLSWLAGNLLLGSQLAWIGRPFIGSPGLAIEFLRDDPLRGNFFEAVFRALQHLT